MFRKRFCLMAFFALFLLGPAVGLVNADPLQQDPGPDGIVAVEAEHYDANVEVNGHAWEEIGPTGGFTGELGMHAPNGNGGHSTNYAANSERLEYEINFVKTGPHYVWILAWAESGSDDSCHAGLDGEETPLSDNMSGWNGAYEWNNGRYLRAERAQIVIPSTGPHTLNIWVREDGLIIDKIVLTTNPDLTLSGNEPGPPESERGLILNAHSPDPADGAIHADTWANLSWTAGATAASHDVYLGENFADVENGSNDTFRANHPSTSFVVGFPGVPYPDGLVPGTTYYWRIDEVEADGLTKHKGSVWSFWVPSLKAYEPSPSDGAKYQNIDVTLSWISGLNAKLHTVYFGESFDEVNDATAGGTARALPNFTPAAPLEHNKTYYWRVDEFGSAGTHKGDVWTFTTIVEIPVTDDTLVGWWKFETSGDPAVLDWSGHGNHGTIVGNVQWVPALFNVGLEFLGDNEGHVELPPDTVNTAQGSVLMWINTEQTDDEGMLWHGTEIAGDGYGSDNEIHINIDDPGEVEFFLEEDGSGSDIILNGPQVAGAGWTHVAATWDLADGCRLYVNGAEAAFAAHNTNEKNLTAMRLGYARNGSVWYEGRMDDVRLFDHAISVEQIEEIMNKGEDPLRASTPNPRSDALVPLVNATPLSWSAGAQASEHDVYFGMDQDAVASADATDTTGVYRGRQTATTYTPPEGVEWAGGPYYWRIDEINTDGTISPGAVWSFTVADYLIVDDFESYNDIETGQPGSRLIYETWLDGFGVPANGSIIGYFEAFQPSMEKGIVYGGMQSVPIMYDNSTASLSEVTADPATLPIGRNWTIGSPQTLVLWFHGQPGNAVTERLYIKINGVKKTYPGDAADIAEVRWTQWDVDLASVGTNLANVTQFVVGFERTGASGGTGTVLLDDIRLYREAPQVVVPSEEIWIEAEDADSITEPMKVYDDATASGGQCIGTDIGIGNASDAPPADGVATYSFAVQGGTYKIAGRVIIPDGDSFWVRVLGATTQTTNHSSGWVRWSDPSTGADWHWEDVFSAEDGGETVLFTMDPGTYTLEIARREDGALVDAIVISKVD